MDKVTETLKLKGPFKFNGNSSIFDEITDVVNGVYLWCIKVSDDSFRVYYVGESIDIKDRMYTHRKNQLSGKYTGHCVQSLKNNIREIMHRAESGIIPRFSEIDRNVFNQEFLDSIYLFYLPITTSGNKDADKWHRCRFETGIVMHIENQGQNIVSVGHLRYWKKETKKVRLVSENCTIESLNNQSITI